MTPSGLFYLKDKMAITYLDSHTKANLPKDGLVPAGDGLQAFKDYAWLLLLLGRRCLGFHRLGLPCLELHHI